MQNRKKFLKPKRWLLALMALALLFVTACQGGGSQDKQSAAQEEKLEEPTTVKLAVGSELGRVIWEDVKKRLQDDNINLELVVMTDWVTPNVAVKEGEVDLNAFQYMPFLYDFNKSHDADLVPIGYATLPPISIYAVDAIKSLDDIPDGASIAMPEDPVNVGHSLLEMEKAGLLTLNATEADNPTLDDVKTNPKNLDFKLMDGATMARALGDVDMIITGSAMAADADIGQEAAIYTEDPDETSNYYKVMMVTQRAKKDDPAIQKVLKAYQSDETKKVMKENFGDDIIPAWKEGQDPVKDYDELAKILDKEHKE